MHDTLNTRYDVLKERFIYHAELVGKYDFPQLPEVHAHPEGLRAVPFNLAKNEKRPKECVAHFFCDDYRFESFYLRPQKYMPILQNFKYVISTDFSAYSDMPLALQIYNRYRNRAMAYYMWLNGLNVIPAVGWGLPGTWDYCFDGLPMHSTLAVSTNGCFSPDGKDCYRSGFKEMCRRLDPDRVVVVGRPIDVDVDVEIVYLQSYGQDMERGIMSGRQSKLTKEKEA